MSVQLAGSFATRRRALGDRCPVDRVMQAVGNRTAVLLLREAFYGATRFEEFVTRVGVTEAVAAKRLKELVGVGVLVKRPYRAPGQRTRDEYVLTDAGHELMPVVTALALWGTRHLAGGGPTFSHDACGAGVEVVLRCTEGHLVEEEDVVVAAG